MTKHLSYLVRWAGVALVIAALLVPGAGRMQAEAGARQASTAPDNSSEAARLEGSIEVAEPPAVHKDSYPKLESRLAQLYESAVLGTGRPLETFAGQRHIDLEAGSARVILEMDADPGAHQAGAAQIETITGDGGTITVQHAPLIGIRADLESAIAATGATYETAYKTMVQVLAPFRSLPALGDIPGVRLVRYPFPSQTQDLEVPSGIQPAPKVGTYTSQGVALTNAGNWIAAGYDGTGVNLAIFDFGFTAYDTRQGTGDLPTGGGLVTHDFGTGGYDFTTDPAGYGHGTSCSEIAFDMAPGATVHLYSFETEIELGNAVTDYINNVSGKKVATMSIGWVNAGPYDGTGVVNTIIDTAQAAGIFFATSAGNHQKSHWSGTSVQYSAGDSIAFGAGNLNFIGSAPGVVWSVTAGTELDIFLEWNDWNSGRTGNQNHVDYDLQLHKYDSGAWTAVATSTANQCTTTVEPTEGIAFTTTATDYYGITIWRDTGGGACTNSFGHWMSLFSFNGFNLAGEGAAHVFAYHNSSNSVGIPGDGDSAVTVGASFWNEDWSAPLYGLETFSSLGPRNASGRRQPRRGDRQARRGSAGRGEHRHRRHQQRHQLCQRGGRFLGHIGGVTACGGAGGHRLGGIPRLHPRPTA